MFGTNPNAIRVQCWTNLDNYARESWPSQLPAVPSKEQKVQSIGGKVLTIVGLTWLADGALEIELH